CGRPVSSSTVASLKPMVSIRRVSPRQAKIEGRAVEQEFGSPPPDAPPPSPDPRDINGSYQQVEEKDDGSVWTKDIVQQCAPELEIGMRGYPEKIVQTPGRITFIQEFNHIVRRIYLDEDFPAQITPSYTGHSVGRWEGDVLVVRTRGVKGVRVAADPRFATVREIEERITKQPDGTVRNRAKIFGADAAGKELVAERSATLLWRPDIRLFEYICEDGAGVEFK
ncbi:hypothetical protein, partial [Phenylobacterium sp.]|uniref:hypothetical protein n=1 Tax=Phenylobacterium sp. TaxID=1871053 RepID=UPI002811A6E8